MFSIVTYNWNYMGRVMEDMIKAEKLTFCYEQSKDGIKDINFNIKVAIILIMLFITLKTLLNILYAFSLTLIKTPCTI